MENTENLQKKQLFLRILRFLVLGLTLLAIGLSFIGKFFDVAIDDEIKTFTFASLLSDSMLSGRLIALNWIIYIGLPLLASASIFLYKKNKNFAFVAMILFLIAAITSLVSKDILPEALYQKIKVEEGIKRSIYIEKVYLWSAIPTVFYFILSLLVLSFASEDIKFSTKDISEMGVLIAAALVLNFIRLFPAPTGGSVNLQMLPLFILAIRKGPIKAFIGCGVVYGLISCLVDGYGLATFPFDYLLGIGSTAILGLFSKQILRDDVDTYNLKGELFIFIGVTLATVLRFTAGTISSMVLYDYDFLPAALYNVGYIFISAAVSLVVVMGLYGPLLAINKRFPNK